MRQWFELRYRECVVPGRFINGKWIEGKYVKKSKFFEANSSREATEKYKGKGTFISCQKVSKERRYGGVREFFTLGDRLLKELSRSEQMEVESPESIANREMEERRRLRRDYFEKDKFEVEMHE